MSANRTDELDRRLIFDAFAVMAPGDVVRFGWPRVTLHGAQMELLNGLLEKLNYLGRSESWVEAAACSEDGDGFSWDWNCRPVTRDGISEGGMFGATTVACPVPRSEIVCGADGGWLEALSMSTAELSISRRDLPPALRFVDYLRIEPGLMDGTGGKAEEANGVIYTVISENRPGIIETVDVAGRIRRKLMGIHKRIAGGTGKVSRNFSGKDAGGRPAQGHRHSHFLPMDKDGDGFIDHFLVIGKEPLDDAELRALKEIGGIWQPMGRPDLRMEITEIGNGRRLLVPGKVFVSATPFVPSRHYRKGRGDIAAWVAGEIRREAGNRGLPEPARIELIEGAATGGGLIKWEEFKRNRHGECARRGYGARLEFREEVPGPFALGYAAHYGLGMFVVEDDKKKGPG
jgi:CRISPR-associated protein Csb2